MRPRSLPTVLLVMLLVCHTIICRAFTHTAASKGSLARRWGTRFRCSSSGSGNEDFDRLPPEVKKQLGGGGGSRGFARSKKREAPLPVNVVTDGIPQRPPFSLAPLLTGRSVALTWTYKFPHGDDLDVPNPWGPVSAGAEQRAMRTLLLPGEFLSSMQLPVARLREIADECVPAPWMEEALAAEGKGDCSDGSDGTADGAAATAEPPRHGPPGPAAAAAFVAALRASAGEHMLLEQALSLRKQLLVDKIVNGSWKLREHRTALRKAYAKGVSLLDLSRENDLPPVAIFRDMLTKRVWARYSDLRDRDQRDLVKAALRGQGAQPCLLRPLSSPYQILIARSQGKAWASLMTPRDKEELARAKEEDHTSYAEDDSAERQRSTAWEESLYAFLDAHGVAYLTETALKDQGSKSTPDCVLLDDVTINGRPVRWVDMKNFYGSARSPHFVDKLTRMQRRYEEAFGGPGAVVYKLGHSEALAQALPALLVLDRGPLVVTPPPPLAPGTAAVVLEESIDGALFM